MSQVTILDGGMGGEILQRYPKAAKGLWSAQALLDKPDVVKAVHQDYIDAGARIIITNSYSTVPSYLDKGGVADRYLDLTSLAGQLAREVADGSDHEVIVAGSLPPLSESYRPDLVPEEVVAKPIYAAMVEVLSPYVDWFICETMSSIQESLNAATQAVTSGKPVYVSWTLNETPGVGLRSGETVADAHAQTVHLEPAGYLFNCTHPEAILVAIQTLSDLTDRPIGCYPNRFDVPEGWTLDNDVPVHVHDDPSGEYYIEAALRCIAAGASIVGGCCGIGPADIARLRQRLSE